MQNCPLKKDHNNKLAHYLPRSYITRRRREGGCCPRYNITNRKQTTIIPYADRVYQFVTLCPPPRSRKLVPGCVFTSIITLTAPNEEPNSSPFLRLSCPAPGGGSSAVGQRPAKQQLKHAKARLLEQAKQRSVCGVRGVVNFPQDSVRDF